MAEQALAGGLRVAVEDVHLFLRVSLRQDGHVYAAVGCPALQQVFVGRDVAQSFPLYQDVLRVDAVLQGGLHRLMRVAQGDFHQHRLFGPGHQEGVFKSPCRGARLVRAQPFLEERGERRAVDDGAVPGVAHRDLPVSGQGQFVQVVPPSRPPGQRGQPVHADGLLAGVAREEVIHAQGLVLEIRVECLCIRSRAEQQERKREEQFSSFHVSCQFLVLGVQI